MSSFNYENWRETYKDREIKPEDLGKIIKPGSNIYIGSACSEPTVLTSQLIVEKFKDQFRDCQIYHFFSLSNLKFFDEKTPTRFRHNTLSLIGSNQMREAVNTGKSDYTPVRSAEIPQLLKSHRYIIHYAILQVSPPDKNGWCSLGINVDVNRSIVDVAKTVIVQINPQMPVTMGDSFIKFHDIDYFLYHDSPLMEYEPPIPDEKSDKIAQYISQLIEDGSTLNLGIGKIPYLLPKYLGSKKNLAIYSEFIMDSIIPLIEKEVINCKQSTHPHCFTSFALGTKKSYSYFDNNPFIEFYPTNVITNISNILTNNKMCSVYSALSVDSIGQVSNEMKSSLYSGIGGEADFMRGTALSEGGKCIVALPSITEEGRSRIVPLLSTQPVELPAFDVHYVVTEYGVAYLHGKSLRERIMQMIGVAHPKYRQWLLESAKKYHFIYEDQKLPQTHEGIVVIQPEIEYPFHTKNNNDIIVRPVRPTDERMLQDLYYSLSDLDRMMRFFRPHKYFSHEETQQQILCDYHKSMVLVGILGDSTNQQIIAVSAYYLIEDTNLADISFTVHPEWRGLGITRFMIEKIIDLTREKGFSGLSGDVMIKNESMVHLLKTLDYKVVFTPEGDSLGFKLFFNTQLPKQMLKNKEK
jgi:acyl-CoA hydrolase/GNAT superfamily N-acetyltransferase